MSTATAAPGFSLVAHIRRLSTAGSVLYIRIGNSDISRLRLGHGRAIEIDLGRVLIAGVVETSGGSPWLATAPGSSNVAITAALPGAHFEHGMDVAATARSLNGGPESGTPVSISLLVWSLGNRPNRKAATLFGSVQRTELNASRNRTRHPIGVVIMSRSIERPIVGSAMASHTI